MIVIMKRGTPQKEIDSLTDALTAKGVEVNPVIGKDLIILGLVGDTSKIDDTWIEANRSVERVMHVAEPFKKANRMFHHRRRQFDRRQTDCDDRRSMLSGK